MTNIIEKFIYHMRQNSLECFANESLGERFEALTERMLDVSQHMNLTTITDTDGIILKHYVDSLLISRLLPENANIIDIGCGAGFPSLPLAIARPDLHVTALDSTSKRISYTRETAELLGVHNLDAVSGRAEDFSRKPEYREKFDIATARAVARLNVLSELCIPFVRVGGQFIAMKAHDDGEIAEAASAIKKLGGNDADITYSKLISDEQPLSRTIVRTEKVRRTPDNYPRNFAQIAKKPL